jgi:adenine deaminase
VPDEASSQGPPREGADLVIEGVKLLNVFTREAYEVSIALGGGMVLDVGSVEDLVGPWTKVIDGRGLYAAPGFIDGHVHLESSHLTLAGFVEAALPHGITSAVFDPHELANVAGRLGVEALMKEAEALPFSPYFTVPSCVPSAPGLETSGAEFSLSDVEALLAKPSVVGLAEVMDYTGVLKRSPELMRKVEASRRLGKVVDGHCPGLRGRLLASYLAAGPSSDHEALSGEEAVEKLRLGAWVMVREGSATKCLDEVLKAVLKQGLDTSRLMIVTDDLDPRDLALGYLEARLKRAVELGMEPIEAVRLVTLNPSTYFRLERAAGAIAPGWRADLLLLRDLVSFEPLYIIVGGEVTAYEGGLLQSIPKRRYPEPLHRSVKLPTALSSDLAIKAEGEAGRVRVRVIKVRDGSLVTEAGEAELKVVNGLVHPSPDEDVLQLAVVERHGRTGGIGLGFISGLGLREGAVATTYAHDAHNAVAAGASWEDMAKALRRLEELQGGVAVVSRGRVLAELRLEVAGLMSYDPPMEVAKALVGVEEALRSLGCKLAKPLQTLSFVALPVIPKLKLTDKGLIDVETGAFVSPILH